MADDSEQGIPWPGTAKAAILISPPVISERWWNKYVLSAALTLCCGLILASIPIFAAHLPPGNAWMRLALFVLWAGIVGAITAIHFLARPLPNFKWWIPILIAIAVATTILIPQLHAQQAIERQIPPILEASSRVTDRIFLYERYGGEWHTSNDQPILFTSDAAVLKNRFENGRLYRFTPTIYNGTQRAALTNVQLYVELPGNVEVQKPVLWVNTEDNAYFANMRSDIPPGGGMTINESLFVTFPAPGRYKVRYAIRGRTATGEGFEPIDRTFEFVLE